MKNNYVAKYAQRSGAGYHTEKNKPEPKYSDIVYHCRDCLSFSIIDHQSDAECEKCGSNKLTQID